MFSASIKVTPYDSSAVSLIEWNSNDQTLTVEYSSGAYVYEKVTFSDFLALATLANQRGSWGSGLHEWKGVRENEFERKARKQFKDTFKHMHPADRTRWLNWMREELIT